MVNEIDIGLKYIDKIFHISDIHVRNLKRHTEYREVFKNLYVELEERKTKNSIIYLAGDIAHAKTEMSPELVQMISEFLSKCAALCPTILIPGNHDANLNNSYRLDVLSPIVENINNNRIVYLKDSGIYNIANLRFVHYGIFDKREDWPVPPDDDVPTYGVFHGPINAARTDIGYEVSNRSITPETFKGCHYVLCGDIHRRQIVDSGSDMVVVYAGSLIQQNHGESLDGHGFIEWDVSSDGSIANVEMVDIKNDWGYYTLDIDNGIVPVVDNMPQNPRLRVRITNTPSSEVKRALAEVRKKYNVSEFTVTRMDTISKLKTGNGENKLNIGDVTDIEYQNNLISDYLTRQLFVDEETLSDIFEINRNINAKLDENSIAKNVNWKPKKFQFSNMFSYGEDNVVEFDNMSGLYGLFAPNASGKSSIFDAISFCIFDKCSRAFKASHIMNNRKAYFDCTLELQIDGVDYFIKRTAKKKKDETVKVDVAFWKVVDGDKINLNGEHRRSTNDVIRKYIGSYDDFVLTTLSLQNQNAIFIDKSQSERKDLLAQFMGINIFDNLYTIAYDEVRDINAQLRKMKNIDYDTQLVEYEQTIKEIQQQYDIDDGVLNNAKKELQVFIADKIKLVHDLTKINPAITDIDSLNASKDIVESKIEKAKTNSNTIKSTIKDCKKEIKKSEAIYEKLKAKDVEKYFNEYKSNKVKEENINTSIDELRNEIEQKSEQLAEYSGLDYSDDCTYCIDNAKKLSSISFELKNDIKQLTVDMKVLITKSNELTDIIEKTKSITADWELYESTSTNIHNLSLNLSNHTSLLSEYKIELHQQKARLKEILKSISEYYKSEEQIKLNATINKEINQLDIEIGNINVFIASQSKSVLSLNSKLAAAQSKLDACNTELSLMLELENTYKTYEYYLAAIKRDGIPYELIVKVLPVIEGEVNSILEQVVDFGMQLEMDGKNINGRLVYEDRSWPLEMCSGMERFISGLAIRVALMNICHLPRSNFLVLDEGMGTLDSNNINNLAWLFDYLKGQFDFIMVISHLDVMRDIIDNLIEIKKVDGFSSINY